MDKEKQDFTGLTRFSNQLNNVPFGSFNSAELNLLFAIITVMKDKGVKTVTFTFDELQHLSDYKADNAVRFYHDLRNTYRKLITLPITLVDEDEITEFVLFTEYTISTSMQTVRVRVNERFTWVLNDLFSNYTVFELQEFTSLKSSYAKMIYKHLKQWRSKGEWIVSVDDFRRLFEVPKSYQMSQITLRILEPSIEELSPFFADLRVEKLTGKGSRRIVKLKFSFTAEKRKEIGKYADPNFFSGLPICNG